MVGFVGLVGWLGGWFALVWWLGGLGGWLLFLLVTMAYCILRLLALLENTIATGPGFLAILAACSLLRSHSEAWSLSGLAQETTVRQVSLADGLGLMTSMIFTRVSF